MPPKDSDDEETPPLRASTARPTPGRARTQGDRDVRRPIPVPRGIGLTEPPEFVSEDITGHYHGEELRKLRAQRAKRLGPDDRFERLEDKHDRLDAKVDDGFAKIHDKLDRVTEGHAIVATKIDIFIEERRDKRKFDYALKLKIVGAVFSSAMLIAILRHFGVL